MLKNNYLYVLIFAISVLFFNCDGRHRAHKTNAEVLKENNLFKSFSEVIKHIPETPVTIKTDTIFNNGFQVKIFYNSVEKNPVEIIETTANDTLRKTIFKNFEAKVQISKSNKVLNQFLLDKSAFKNFESEGFWKKAIMQHVWIDFEASTDTKIYLKTAFHDPESNTYRDFQIAIDDFGQMTIQQIQLTKTTI